MDNPWKDLAIDSNGEYVASCDRNALEPFLAITDAEEELQLSVSPEPFIGDPSTASFVAMQLNSGSSRSDDYERKISSDVRAFAPKREKILANPSGGNKGNVSG